MTTINNDKQQHKSTVLKLNSIVTVRQLFRRRRTIYKQAMALETNSMKWTLPGWRIQRQFNNHVLIGNWNEERRKFQRGRSHYNSTHRTDFKNYGNFKPETSIRRQCVMTSDGVGKHFLFSHHGNTYASNISWYDQQFNQREINESHLPPLRKWDAKILAYVPEKTDYPIQGPPTNYGLHQQLKQKWKEQEELENVGDYSTTYRLSFIGSKPVQRDDGRLKSTPQFLSSKLHPHQVNKDLHLREVHKNTPPERPPILNM